MDRQVLPLAETAGYEVALEVLADLIGHASGRIDEENAKPVPDWPEIARWRVRRDTWASRHRGLNPRDAASIRQVLEQDAAVLRSLVEGGRR